MNWYFSWSFIFSIVSIGYPVAGLDWYRPWWPTLQVSTTFFTCYGISSASFIATSPPRLHPTTVNGAKPSAVQKDFRSPAKSSRVDTGLL